MNMRLSLRWLANAAGFIAFSAGTATRSGNVGSAGAVTSCRPELLNDRTRIKLPRATLACVVSCTSDVADRGRASLGIWARRPLCTRRRSAGIDSTCDGGALPLGASDVGSGADSEFEAD